MRNRIENLTEGQKKGMYDMLVNSTSLTTPEAETLEQLAKYLKKDTKENSNTKKFLETIKTELDIEDQIQAGGLRKWEKEELTKDLAKNLKKQNQLAKKIDMVQWSVFIEPLVLYTWEER